MLCLRENKRDGELTYPPGEICRQETEHMFYHGFENYMSHAFPEDELRPLSCGPLFRDRENPGHAELNDVLGNYSLTLIDTLSSLAILSSSPEDGGKAWGSLSGWGEGFRSVVWRWFGGPCWSG